MPSLLDLVGRGKKKDSVGDRLRSQGFQRGLMGGSMAWTAVAGVTYGAKALRWALRPEAPVILTESIEPGETLVITHVAPEPTRSRRRKARRRAARVAEADAARARAAAKRAAKKAASRSARRRQRKLDAAAAAAAAKAQRKAARRASRRGARADS